MDLVEAISHQRKIKQPFTVEEDIIIEKHVYKFGLKNLEQLETRLENRSIRQIRERYRLYLDPKVNHSPFTSQEDELLLNAFVQFDGKWCLITKLFSGRTDVALKHQYRKLMRKSNDLQRTKKINFEDESNYIFFDSFYGEEFNNLFEELLKDSQGFLVENLFGENKTMHIQ
jgi:hypothetical protein